MKSRIIHIEKRRAMTFEIDKGNHFKILQKEGNQIAGLLAFKRADLSEHFSQGNTRISLSMGPFKRPGSKGVVPFHIQKSDILLSNRWNRMLTLTKDTYGKHDIMFDPCDSYLNVTLLREKPGYPGCRELHAEVLKKWDIPYDSIPAGINLFQNTLYMENGMFTFPTKSKQNDYVIFKADMDLLISLTACPCPLDKGEPIQIEILP